MIATATAPSTIRRRPVRGFLRISGAPSGVSTLLTESFSTQSNEAPRLCRTVARAGLVGIVAAMEMMGNESMIWEGHPTWRAMLSFHIKWIAITLVVFGFLVLLDSIGVNLPTTLIGAVLIGGIALTILAGWIDRFFTQYTITTKRLNVRRGILSKTESSTNVDRIQNITVSSRRSTGS